MVTGSKFTSLERYSRTKSIGDGVPHTAFSSRYAVAMSTIRLRCRSMMFGGTGSVVRVASHHPGQVSTLFTSVQASSSPTGAPWG
ncbi:MAG: hypothetical protein EBR99_07600, partial [Actinobacteria bacterium]|nr:hypothetical protein [Actinomycetota bacterium]